MRKRQWNRKWAWLLVFAMLITVLPGGTAALAAKKPKLNKKKATISVGKTVKLKLKGTTKKVKWSSNKKKIATVNKKGLVKGKKAGTAKITAKCAGKKYTCKVTVKAVGSGNNTNSTENPSGSSNPSASPSAKPDSSANPNSSAAPNFADKATTTSSQVVPSSAPADSLAVGNLQVTLGKSSSEVESTVGGKPDRTETSPLNYSTYIYNPSMDYTNYTRIQFDNDKVVAIQTMSNYFCYEGLVTSGVDTAETLLEKGFKSMSAQHDYEAGYMLESDKEYVTAFVDHQGSKKVYAIGVYAKATSSSDNTKLDELTKAEYGTYNTTVNTDSAKELFDWACAFRVAKGLTPFTYYEGNGAQLHAEDMATKDFVDITGSDGSGMWERFDKNYNTPRGAAECNSARSLDAFGMVTWILDDTDTTSYASITKSQDKYGENIAKYYLCTGFANSTKSADVTFATLDLFFY